MYTTVIFDLDGTLLDTVQDLADATNQALVKNGYDALATENYNHYLGDGVYNLMIRVLEDQPIHKRPVKENVDRVIKQLVIDQKSVYKDLWKNHTTPYPHIIDLLNTLKSKSSKLAVVSNKPHAFAVLMTEYFFGSETFQTIVGQQDGIPVKPAPDAVFSAMNTLGVEKSQVLYVGDTNTDMLTAKNANITSVGVTWGFREEKELLEHGATHIVHDALEIIDLYVK